MATITLYGPPPSSYVRTARMTCLEKGVDHELRPVEFGSDTHQQLHPFGRVPALEHGSVRLYETQAICHYVDAAFDGPSLVPSNPADVGRMHQWISNLNCYAYDDMVRNYALQYIFPKGEGGQPDRAVIDESAAKVKRELELLNSALDGREWIAGTFSIADLFWAPVLATVGNFPEAREALQGCPNVRGFIERVTSRDSFKAASPPPPQG